MSVTEPTESDLAPGPLLRWIKDRRVAYVLVGIFNTANGFALFVAGTTVLGDEPAGYLTSLLIAHVISVLCAFVLHRRFVFRVKGHVLPDLARFELVNLSALAYNLVMLPLLVEVAGLPVILAQVVAGGSAIVGTYFAHLFFSFRRPPPSGEGAPSPSQQ